MNREILFKNFQLAPHEEEWNQMLWHLIKAREHHDRIKEILFVTRSKDEEHKFLAGSAIKGTFQVMLDRLIDSADRYHGGLEHMKVRKEKGNAR